MVQSFELSNGLIAAFAVTSAVTIFLPFVLGLLAQQRFQVGWRFFAYGALIFFLFQVISRIPLVQIIQVALAPQLRDSGSLQVVYIAGLSLSAGLFEEIGRYVGYRWLMRTQEKSWEQAIMYGLGHGGIESVLIVGIPLLVQLFSLMQLSTIDLMTLPDQQRATVMQQLEIISSMPTWMPLLGAWERMWTIVFHVAMSVVVLQVFRRGGLRWLLFAILGHTVFNFVVVMVAQSIPNRTTANLAAEALVLVVGLLSIGIIHMLHAPALEPGAEPTLDSAPHE